MVFQYKESAAGANSAPPLGTPASTRLGEQPYSPKPTPKLNLNATEANEFSTDSQPNLPASVPGATYATTYYTFDLRGNTANRVDQNANVVTSAYYNAYGARGSTNYDDDLGPKAVRERARL